jgi:hypothetical protein
MGFMDSIKKKIGAAKDAVAPQQAPAPEPEQVEEEDSSSDSDSDSSSSDDDSPQFDLAGFDPDDEEAFFHAMLHMESEGMFGGTDESRAEICERYGIRDRLHWQTVRDSVFSVLARKYGSYEEAVQREMNWRQGQMQNHMSGQVAKAAASGELNPVEGISLEKWAAINAAIVGGANHEDLLRGQGIDQARWDRINAEWNARMARDTTFAVAKIYGEAFQNASKGKYAEHVREANAARAANRDLQCALPMTYEAYYDLLLQQAYASKRGEDPIAALKACNLSVVDWTDLGTVMGYAFHRDAVRNWNTYQEIHQRLDAKYAAMNPGVKPDLDIKF